MTSPQYNPRRRLINKDTPPLSPGLPPLPHGAPSEQPCTNLPLRKSSTFHTPTTPPSQDNDPIVNIPLLPRRSPTCAKSLEDAVAAGEKRIQHLMDVVDRSLSGLEEFSSDSQETLRAEDLPVPRFMLDAHVGDTDSMDIDRAPNGPSPRPFMQRPSHKHHTSDSGIGSTTTGSEHSSLKMRKGMTQSHHACRTVVTKAHGTSASKPIAHNNLASMPTNEIQSGINGSAAAGAHAEFGSQHALSEYACRHIQKHLISPIITEGSLKDFHPLVRGIPYRVGRKEITCLRDLEKVLLWLAPKWSVSKKSFLNFCETTIQCLHTTVGFLNEQDQRRPTDRPYTNGYFLDLTEQVRQYAAMINASRTRLAAGKRMTDKDCTSDERLALHGGLSQTGHPVELVRVKNGQSISLRTGSVVDPLPSSSKMKRSVSEESDDDLLRSMARRRKSAQAAVKEVQQCRECDKVFKRPCDLTKHEKTHSRPWKCNETSCKYHHYGWPTEKERDRHVNDKHSVTPSMYKCQFHPCPYESKRESNCKQHMEKAHGWAYVRSKNNGKSNRKGQSGKALPVSKITTPIFDASSPELGESSSSYAYGGAYSVAPSVNGSDDSLSHSALNTPYMELDERFVPFGSSFPWNEPFNGFPAAAPSPYTPSSHRPSFDAASMTNAPTIPSSFESSMTPLDQDPLLTENFDWSNLNTNNDFTSLNIQLVTPASSVEVRPVDAFGRNPSISLDQAPGDQISSLSPGAQGNVMLYSPYSQNDCTVDEGYEDFTTDTGKPASDFTLFDGGNPSTSLVGTGNERMFQDLPTFTPNVWSGRGTELAQQFGMNNFMDEE